MFIRELHVRNFRSLEEVDLEFDANYTAICGRNDAGKSNLIRALRILIPQVNRGHYFFPEQHLRLNHESDYPQWRDDEGDLDPITISATIDIHSDVDAGLYNFLENFLSLTEVPEVLRLSVVVAQKRGEMNEVRVVANEISVETLKAQEVLKRIRSAGAVHYHDSTEQFSGYAFSSRYSYPESMRREMEKVLKEHYERLSTAFDGIAEAYQADLSGVLGRIGGDLRVELHLPDTSGSSYPVVMSLGRGGYAVPLESWGSGTRNRTEILMSLIRAKQQKGEVASADKTTPITVVEEPESFLHPSAQAEFGRVLNEMANEFGIQVISTTHSPYLLCSTNPKANILVHREEAKGTVVRKVDGEQWMTPYADVLGVHSDELKPWQDIMFTASRDVLLVEGELDREYLDELKRQGRFSFKGEILPYDGTGNLRNPTLLRFVTSRARKALILFDRDEERPMDKCLSAVGLKDGVDYLAVGLDVAGKRCIEGLLPEQLWAEVCGEDPSLIMRIATATADEKKAARSELKRKLLKKFQSTDANVCPSPELWKLAQQIETLFR